ADEAAAAADFQAAAGTPREEPLVGLTALAIDALEHPAEHRLVLERAPVCLGEARGVRIHPLHAGVDQPIADARQPTARCGPPRDARRPLPVLLRLPPGHP